MLDHINFARNKTLKSDDLQKFTGRYRKEGSEYNIDYFIHNDHLLRKAANLMGSFNYPISDTSFVWLYRYYGGSYGYFGGLYGYYNASFCINRQGKVFKLIDKWSDRQSLSTYWKQDSLILDAEKLLESNRHQEALIAFQKAYSENPEHYYLSNYIQHLEFIQSHEYEKIKPVLESYAGEYGDVKIFKEKNQFFLKDYWSRDYELLPLSEDQFMNPSAYYYHIKIVKEDNQIRGLKFIVINGEEYFFERTVEKALANQNK